MKFRHWAIVAFVTIVAAGIMYPAPSISADEDPGASPAKRPVNALEEIEKIKQVSTDDAIEAILHAADQLYKLAPAVEDEYRRSELLRLKARVAVVVASLQLNWETSAPSVSYDSAQVEASWWMEYRSIPIFFRMHKSGHVYELLWEHAKTKPGNGKIRQLLKMAPSIYWMELNAGVRAWIDDRLGYVRHWASVAQVNGVLVASGNDDEKQESIATRISRRIISNLNSDR